MLTTQSVPPTNPDYEKFLKHLADLKEAERKAKEKAAADYEERVKRLEEGIDQNNTPLMMNVNEMMKFRCEDEEVNKRVKDTFRVILKNDIREAMWNSTRDAPNNTETITYDDGYGDISYETRTQYVYDPTNFGVFENEPATRSSKFCTYRASKTTTTMSSTVIS